MAERKYFGKRSDALEIPDLIAVQLQSYDDFLQPNAAPDKRAHKGLQAVFEETFPWDGYNNTSKLKFESYELGNNGIPRYSIVDCIKDGRNYEVPLYLNLILDKDGVETKGKLLLCEMPVMTPGGSFIINGAERVVTSQLHRSPGICFEKERRNNGHYFYCLRIIPDRGSWLDIEFDNNGVLQIYVDRKRRSKFNLTTFLRTVGFSTNRELVGQFYEIRKCKIEQLEKLVEQGRDDGEKGKIARDELAKYYTFDDIVTPVYNEIIVSDYKQIAPQDVALLRQNDITTFELAYVGDMPPYLFETLHKDQAHNEEEAFQEIYRRIRPNDPYNASSARPAVRHLYFDDTRYSLASVGRFKLNERLGVDVDPAKHVLDAKDLIAAVRKLFVLRSTDGGADDIDHLGVRRVRTVGEQLQTVCRAALIKTMRNGREHISDSNDMTPEKLFSAKSFSSAVRDFFARSQLSQFMDQINPLAELTNKRRLSALGPGGLNRDRAGTEVRDVHTSHYGRICPIETPEGPNIGLITSLALYSRINEYGFIETPYRKVVDGKVTDEIVYFTADKEEEHVIAQANALLDENNHFVRDYVICRHQGEFEARPRETIEYMDVSPRQMVSAAAGVIPYLEHDDANRALMGSNMQRQAVPLLRPEAPYVGTGLEGKIARDSRSVVLAQEEGTVTAVNSQMIEVTPADKKLPVHTYQLFKFMRSNNSTCINQRPVVRSGQQVKPGDLLADGTSTDGGELALGHNVLVAFMPWCGYNFEDAIVVSERLIKDDVFTSIHIDDYLATTNAGSVNQGAADEITRDIPEIGADALRNLDERGIIRIGASVEQGDILVGKISTKSENEISPFEKLLQQIYVDKSNDIKNTSLKLPTGKSGVVIDVRVEEQHFTTGGQEKSKSERKAEQKEWKKQSREREAKIKSDFLDDLGKAFRDEKLRMPVICPETKDASGKTMNLIPANRKISDNMLLKVIKHYDEWQTDDADIAATLREITDRYAPALKQVAAEKERIAVAYSTDSEPRSTGIVTKAKVYVACKRKLQIGDKMAGRHGNKGIVSRIVPVEDMPFLADGTPVDIVLNPLGVPSRMNLGQVLETQLGWAAQMLGIKVATPVFEGISESKIQELMVEANERFAEEHGGKNYHWGFRLDEKTGKYVYDGKTDVYDGRTGDRFDQRVMVGQIYMLKLDHLVANKIHARSMGPYSLVTQQPLGGKAQGGGQRFGEMEVWALEAYGAAYTLQEMLTVKSDDRIGRIRIYNSITEGKNLLEAGRPESFNVMLKEIQSLGLDIRPIKFNK